MLTAYFKIELDLGYGFCVDVIGTATVFTIRDSVGADEFQKWVEIIDMDTLEIELADEGFNSHIEKIEQKVKDLENKGGLKWTK